MNGPSNNGPRSGSSKGEKPSSAGGSERQIMYAVKQPYVVEDVETSKVMYPLKKEEIGLSDHNLIGSTSRGTVVHLTDSTCSVPCTTESLDNLEKRQMKIIEQLESLRDVVASIHENCGKTENVKVTESTSTTALSVAQDDEDENEDIDIVITANPDQPPFSLMFFANLIEKYYANAVVSMQAHTHSSYKCTDRLNTDVLSVFNQERDGANFRFTLIWKNLDKCTMMVSPTETNINGEANIAKFLSRLLPSSSELSYDALNWEVLVRVDQLLGISTADNVLQIVDQELKKAGSAPYLTGKPSIADLVLYSAIATKIIQGGQGQKNISMNVKKWLKAVEVTYGYSNSA